MTQALHRLAEQAHPGFPVTIYYAFKQSERKGDAGIASTGWETFLDAVIQSGFAITGTWPMRTELGNRMIGMGTNALASSVVLVCRRRPADAPAATRREFLTALRSELPQALRLLQTGNVAPVDLAQAAIGPGMAVYTRYARVLDAAGKPMSVRAALALINQTLDEVLAEQEGDFDADSRWALAWFEQHGFDEGALRRGRDALEGEEHERRRHGRCRDHQVTGGQGPSVEAEGTARRLGPGSRRAADRVGSGPSPDPRSSRRAAKPAPRKSSPPSAARPKPPASSATGCTRCASGRSARPRRCRTTASCRAGRRSPAWLVPPQPSRWRCSTAHDDRGR